MIVYTCVEWGEPDDELIDAKANRFAAEFLLPTESLTTYVKKHNRGEVFLKNWSENAILRLIAQIQIDYQVLYRMIIKRLYEVDSINSIEKEDLLAIDERNENSVYYKIGKTMNDYIFKKLNTATLKSGVDSEALNVILQNYDEGIITVDTTVKDLKLC